MPALWFPGESPLVPSEVIAVPQRFGTPMRSDEDEFSTYELGEIIKRRSRGLLLDGIRIWEARLVSREGVVGFIYKDSEGFHTTGKGSKISLEEAVKRNIFLYRSPNGKPREATKSEIEAAFKDAPSGQTAIANLRELWENQKGMLYNRPYIESKTIDSLYDEDKRIAISDAAKIFGTNFQTAEPEAVAVMLDMPFAHGNGPKGVRTYPKCIAAMKASFSPTTTMKQKADALRIAAEHCQAKKAAKNSNGWKERNAARSSMLLDAADRIETVGPKVENLLPSSLRNLPRPNEI